MNCPHCQVEIADGARFCGACGRTISSTQEVSHAGQPSSSTAEAPSLIGREIAGRYRVRAKLGEGGMGAVYKAEQMSLKRTVAVKLLRPEVASSQLLLARFNAEAQAVAKLSHPNTVNIYDFGQDGDGTLFIAMEFIEGKSLRQVIHTEAPLPLRRTLNIASQIAASLVDAHAASIIHRDLKPDNVMMQDRGKQRDVVRVLDFGIAKLRDEGRQTQMAMTQAGDMLGTPQYMAPEQIRAEHIDGRTDVYALGCILYEMITGRLPFEGTTVMALLSKHLTEQVVPPSARRPELNVPPAIDQLVLAAMAKDPNARPATMDLMGEHIASILASLPVGTQEQTAQVVAQSGASGVAAMTPTPVPQGQIPTGPGGLAPTNHPGQAPLGPVGHAQTAHAGHAPPGHPAHAGQPFVPSSPPPGAPLSGPPEFAPASPPPGFAPASPPPNAAGFAPAGFAPPPSGPSGSPLGFAPTPSSNYVPQANAAPYDPLANRQAVPATPSAAKKSNALVWIILGGILLAGTGAGIYFGVIKKDDAAGSGAPDDPTPDDPTPDDPTPDDPTPDDPDPPDPDVKDPWAGGGGGGGIADPTPTAPSNAVTTIQGIHVVLPAGFTVLQSTTDQWAAADSSRGLAIAIVAIPVGTDDAHAIAREYASSQNLTILEEENGIVAGKSRTIFAFQGTVGGEDAVQAGTVLIGPRYRAAIVFHISQSALAKDATIASLVDSFFLHSIFTP
ncbi:MAG: protein kinase domain-containing protein [Kofleriaceae bacterium]